MSVIGFESLGAFLLFCTSLLCGITMVIGVDAVNSAPTFMLDYYQYLNKNPDATPKHPTFWTKVLTFYTIVTIVAQSVHEPTNVTQFLCRFSLLFRMEISTILMLVELLIIVVMPHTGTSEEGAMVGLMIAAYLGGAGRAYFENTGYALFGPCPSIHLAGLLIGSALCGALVSIVQLVLLGTMSTDYHSVLIESIYYFTISIIIISVCALLIIAMLRNTFAQHYIAEFRSKRSIWSNIYTPYKKAITSTCMSDAEENKCDEYAIDESQVCKDDNNNTYENSDKDNQESNKNGKCPEVCECNLTDERNVNNHSHSQHRIGSTTNVHNLQYQNNISNETIHNIYEEFTQHFDCKNEAMGKECNKQQQQEQPLHISTDEKQMENVHEPIENINYANSEEATTSTCANKMNDENMTSSTLLQSALLWNVIRQIWPMMLSELAVFGITYIMYPGVLVAVDPDNAWFTTIMMAVYNFGDFFGRVLSMVKAFWPSRRVVVIGSCVRVIFIPLLILCAKGVIPTQAAGYVLTAILAITNGFFGTLTMVYTPLTPGLMTDGERALAGQCTGVCLLIGCSVGSLLQLAIVIPL